MFPILQIGPLALPVPGLALLAGVWVGSALAEREAVRLKLDPAAVYNLVFVGLIAGMVGARLAYVARYSSAYASDPLSVFALNAVANAPMEGTLIGVVAALIYGACRKLPLRPTLDALAPGLAVMGVAVAIAHLASGDAFGTPARLPWSIYLWDEYRQPSQAYELVAALSVLGIAWRVRQREPVAGFNFLLVVALSAAARIFLETFRGDSLVIAGGFRLAQVWGLVALASCLGAMRYWGREVAP